MRLSIETLTAQNYGDHAERVRTSHAQVDDETVEDLVRRVFPDLSGTLYRPHDATAEIVIRVVLEPDGTPSGQLPGPEGVPW